MARNLRSRPDGNKSGARPAGEISLLWKNLCYDEGDVNGKRPMDEVFMLRHVHEFEDGHEDVKIIGVYRTRADAELVLGWIREQPGFRDHLGAFAIEPYGLNHTEWREGFVTAHSDGSFSN